MRVFNIEMDKLKSEAGVIELIKFLDDFYKKDDWSGAYDAWRSFDQCKRTGNQSIDEYTTI